MIEDVWVEEGSTGKAAGVGASWEVVAVVVKVSVEVVIATEGEVGSVTTGGICTDPKLGTSTVIRTSEGKEEVEEPMEIPELEAGFKAPETTNSSA